MLTAIGWVSQPNQEHISLDPKATVSTISQEMKDSVYDYLLFDNKTGKILKGHYVKADFPNYQASRETASDISDGTVDYQYVSNGKITLIVRKNMVPEFVSHRFRWLSFNDLTYPVLILCVLLVISLSVYRLVKELSKNFQQIQKIALNMGAVTADYWQGSSKIREFDDVLTNLYAKSEELALLIEAEKNEKKDLSFQVAALSHDIKTPLTVLKGNIELLEMTELSYDQQEFINSMEHSLSVFEQYFTAMVNYTKLLYEDVDYREEINLEDFLLDLAMGLEEVAQKESVDFQLENKAKLSIFHGNALALNRALINIFVNACQYAKVFDKKVILSIYEDENHLYFDSWNNGQPFSEEAKQKAEKLFFTEDSGRSGKHYGIGLSFAYGVALKHHGQLLISNPKTGGARVVISIKK